MMSRPSTPGWCPSIRAVLDKPWWPGRLLYEGQTYTDKAGVEHSVLMAMCPYCGKWVHISHDDEMIGHTLPAGSDAHRYEKAKDAQAKYGKMVARDLMRAEALAS